MSSHDLLGGTAICSTSLYLVVCFNKEQQMLVAGRRPSNRPASRALFHRRNGLPRVTRDKAECQART